MTREDIEFRGEGDVTLRGWFYPAQDAAGQAPVVVMAHGLSAVKEMYLDDYAAFFAEGGLNVVLYDNRNFGASDGWPRQEIDPVLQYRDYRNAITFACTRSEVDSAKIGIWGSSFSGGHVLTVASIDKRVKAAVAQVPFISGPRNVPLMLRPDVIPHVREVLDGDRANRFAGGDPATMPVVAPDPTAQAFLPSTDSYEWFTKTSAERAPNWKNEVTVRSLESLWEYDPSTYVSRIAPTPLLMIVAREDVVAPFELALEAYEQARQPKKLTIIPGGHFDAYIGETFTVTATAAREHFLEHLSV